MPNKCIGLENMCLVLALEDLMHDDRLFIQPQYVTFCVNKTLSNSLKTTKNVCHHQKCLSLSKMSVIVQKLSVTTNNVCHYQKCLSSAKNVCHYQKCLSPQKMSVTIKMFVTTKNVCHNKKRSVTIKKICDHKKNYITLEISKSQDN